MKKTMLKLKFKITAVMMSALMAFSALSLSSGVAFAAEGKGSADSVIPGPAYDIGLLLMENFVPGGSVIGPGFVRRSATSLRISRNRWRTTSRRSKTRS